MTPVLKRRALHLLTGLNAVLLGILLLSWVAPNGSLQGSQWEAPAPRLNDFAAQAPNLPAPAPADTTGFVALLDKPLFSPNRRPPEPEPPPDVVAAAPVDNFSTAKLTGLFNSAGASGLIMHIAGRDVRVQLNQSFDGWTLQSIGDREATFASGGQTRVLQLKRADISLAVPGAANAGAVNAPPTRALPFVPAPFADPAAAKRPESSATASSPDASSAASITNAKPDPNQPSFGGGR